MDRSIARLGNVVYFVRDDDVGELTDELRAFVALFIDRRLPVSYQIIPEALTEECARFLRQTWLRHPTLVEFGQHGLRHRMMLKGRPLKREFGPERPYDEQLSDIAEGVALLRERLGTDVPLRVFTPPQHKYDRNTVIAAASVGYTTFSASQYASWRHRIAYGLGRRLALSSLRHHGISRHGRRRPEAQILELSIAIAVDDGQSPRLRAAGLPTALARAARHTDVVGLMLHHNVYNSAGRAAGLTAIADSLAEAVSGSARLLGELADTIDGHA